MSTMSSWILLWIVTAVPLYLMGGLSGYALFFWEPEEFMRLGSMGVFVALVVFGLTAASKSKTGKLIAGDQEARLSEVFLGAISTLQWGYGDKFHCWFHDNGWSVCYG